MASNKKIERALHGPGLFEITLGVILSVTLGVLLAVVHLVFKPVEVVSKLPDDAAKGSVYFVEGANHGGQGRQWVRKRQLLQDASAADVTFTEDELNAWVSSATAQTTAGTGLVVPEKINFRIQDGVLQVGVTNRVTAAGVSVPLIVQTRGHFEPGTAGFVYTADELYIGALPTQRIPGLKDYLIKRALATQEFPEDLQATWSKLKLVAVEGNTLHVATP